jgi:protein-tyrosine-phosphatase
MQIRSVLFVGRRNAARSVMAETCFNAAEIPGWRAFSAGWQTEHSVDRTAVKTLAANGFETDTLSSKPVAIFLQDGAPAIDLCVFMDEDLPPDVGNYPAAREYWKIPDPSRDGDLKSAYQEALKTIMERISMLVISGRLAMPLAKAS